MQTMIEFRHVRKAYGEKVILKDFSLSVEKGEFVTIIKESKVRILGSKKPVLPGQH